MSSKLLSLSIVAGSLALTLPTATFAKPIRYVGPEALKGLCQSNNGTFLPQTPEFTGLCLHQRRQYCHVRRRREIQVDLRRPVLLSNDEPSCVV